jgi:hypothetical protein
MSFWCTRTYVYAVSTLIGLLVASFAGGEVAKDVSSRSMIYLLVFGSLWAGMWAQKLLTAYDDHKLLDKVLDKEK